MTAVRTVVHVVDDLRVGGAQQLLLTWSREAARRGEPVAVVALEQAPGPVASQLRAAGAEVLVLAGGTGARGFSRQVRLLARFLRARRPVVVQTHLTRAHVVGVVAARLARVPSVATLHSARIGGDGNSSRALRVETVLLRRGADAVLACGAVVARSQAARLAPRVPVIVPNASEPVVPSSDAVRATLRAQLGVADRDALALAVGRLSQGKGYDELMDAFATVVDGAPHTHLAVVGDGPEGVELRRRAAEPPLAGRVHVLGQRADVSDLMAAADLYVSASHAEGLPLALLEAMSAALPVVVTAVGDVPTVVVPDCGTLVPPHDAPALAAAVLEMLRQPTLLPARGQAARRRAAEVADVGQWYDRVLSVHDAAARGRSSAADRGSRVRGPRGRTGR